jgi:hypothetical protein
MENYHNDSGWKFFNGPKVSQPTKVDLIWLGLPKPCSLPEWASGSLAVVAARLTAVAQSEPLIQGGRLSAFLRRTKRHDTMGDETLASFLSSSPRSSRSSFDAARVWTPRPHAPANREWSTGDGVWAEEWRLRRHNPQVWGGVADKPETCERQRATSHAPASSCVNEVATRQALHQWRLRHGGAPSLTGVVLHHQLTLDLRWSRTAAAPE